MSSTKRMVSPMKCQNDVISKKPKIDELKTQDIKLDEKELKNDYELLFLDDEDFDLAAINTVEQNECSTKLDLTDWKRCMVEAVNRDRRNFDLILRLHEDDSGDKENCAVGEISSTTCYLRGPWSHTNVKVGSIVSVQAVWDSTLAAYKVDKDFGFCITNSDTLIPGTSVVGSLFCRRKAVLQDRFKGIDASNKVMVIGSIVHQLLQIVLSKNLNTYDQISKAAQELLKSEETAYMLYASLLTRDETDLEIMQFVPNILSFIEEYVNGKEPAVNRKNLFQGTITNIVDIEENLWVPKLGLKGKIDASVRIQRRRNTLKYDTINKDAIPLELKTGRASFSAEHKGQVILYQMMLTATGRETHSGLLLYLREGMMREIRASRNEERDLILVRNDLGHYLTSLPQLPPNNAAISCGANKFVQPFELPEPISHHSACSTCAYGTICCTFARTDPEIELQERHPLRKVMNEVTNHLQAKDYEYFIHWCWLLSLEEQEAKKTNYLRSLWTDSPERRHDQGRAIIDLELQEKVEAQESRFVHNFILNDCTDNVQVDLTLSGFSVGEYVIVSTRKRLAVAAGFVESLGKDTVSVCVERNLLLNYGGQKFIIDKHESQSGNVFNYTNLSLLLEDNMHTTKLRNIVVHREQPTFCKLLPKSIAKEGTAILKELNAVQRSAVLKALTTESYMLIKGLPGTGKTQTLVAIVRLLNLMGKSVLVTSHTHSAVDNLLLRLKPHALPMLRLGSGARIHPQLLEFCESEIMRTCNTVEMLVRKYAEYNIVGVTCLGAAHSIFLHRKFDFCIVDEATQVMQCTVLRPLLFCEKFILVGDPDQLPPLIRSKEARQRCADESLFHRLDSETSTSTLTLQYRMNKTITKLANELTYAGALQCASEDVQISTIKLPTSKCSEKWLQRILQTHIDQSVFLVDTLDCAERSHAFASTKHSNTCSAIEEIFAEDPATIEQSHSAKKRLSKYTNYCEAVVIFDVVKSLLQMGYDAERIGIIAPYRAQVELLRKLATQYHSYFQKQSSPLNFSSVEVNTVDQYQGRDKDIILYSGSKTGSTSSDEVERSREAEILEDKRRLTVAITRSKFKLILIGDAARLQQYTPFRSLLAQIPSYCRIKLEDGKLDFNWQILLEQLSKIIAFK